MKRVVIIGGGTGTFTLLSGLKNYPVNLSVIVPSSDDGGSTGDLRKKLNVFPPGDIRQCLAGLAQNQTLARVFSHRFESGPFRGHTVGNLILAGMQLRYGSIDKAIEAASALVNAKGGVLPVTLMPTTLSAIYEDGRVVVGEHNIDEPKKDFRFKILDLRLRPQGPTNPKVIKAIKQANAIIFSPGDLYTSLLPNLLVKGVAKAIIESKAKKILVANIVTKPGQTDGFKLSDFVAETNKYLGKNAIDIAIVNNKKPEQKMLRQYARAKSELVVMDTKVVKDWGVKIVEADLISSQMFEKAKSDKLTRSVLRHDSTKTAKIIYQLIK